MEGSMIDLSKYRFESAKDDLETAQLLIKGGKSMLDDFDKERKDLDNLMK